MSNLKIEYSSSYELFELFKKHPEQTELVYKKFAKAQKEYDTAIMNLEILTAELIDEICNSRKVPGSARQEVRRAEVQKDKRWQIAKRRTIDAKEKVTILRGYINGMYSRSGILEILGKLELKMMYITDPTVYDKSGNLSNYVDLPEEDND